MEGTRKTIENVKEKNICCKMGRLFKILFVLLEFVFRENLNLNGLWYAVVDSRTRECISCDVEVTSAVAQHRLRHRQSSLC